MTEFGKTLREAREKKGLTIAQIAEQTHLLPQIVEDLENEDFHRISAPIYGRGFVKLYCETVDLEAKPLVDEFMAILNGERAPAIKMKEVELPAEEKVEKIGGGGDVGVGGGGDAGGGGDVGEERMTPPPVYTQPELGESVDEVEKAGGGEERTDSVSDESSTIIPTPTPSPTPTPTPSPTPTPTPSPTPRQYHPDYAQSAVYGPSINFGRLAILVGGAIIILVGLFFGIRALYRASMGVSATPETPQEVNEVKAKGEGEQRKDSVSNVAAPSPRQNKTKPSASDTDKAQRPQNLKQAPRQKRTPKPVKPLYID